MFFKQGFARFLVDFFLVPSGDGFDLVSTDSLTFYLLDRSIKEIFVPVKTELIH